MLAIIVVLVELGQVGYNQINGQEWEPYLPLETAAQYNSSPIDLESAPDIHLVLLDGYTGNTSLQKHWDFDNSPFTDSLTEKGFVVNAQSMSNYNETLNSLASMLNGCYLPNYRAEVDNPITENTICRMWIKDNAVTQHLEKWGYNTVNFSLFDISDEPYYMDYDFLQVHGVSFSRHLFKKTLPGRIHAERYYKTLSPTKGPDLFEKTAFVVRETPGQPQFVYSHVMMPHRPYSTMRKAIFILMGRENFRAMNRPTIWNTFNIRTHSCSTWSHGSSAALTTIASSFCRAIMACAHCHQKHPVHWKRATQRSAPSTCLQQWPNGSTMSRPVHQSTYLPASSLP